MTNGQLAAVILLIGFLIMILVAVAICEYENSHERRVARMLEKEERAKRQIDETAAYYTGLFEYISKRLDDRSRRR